MSKLVPRVLLHPYSATMANDINVRRSKAAFPVWCAELRPGGKRCSESSLFTLACAQQNFARHEDATVFWLGQTVLGGSTVPTHHPG